MGYLPFDLTLSTTLSNSQAQANDAALDTAISGNLTQANMSADTRFPNAMLASPNVEELIVLPFVFGSFNGAASGLTVGNKVAAGIHGTSNYTILGARLDFNCVLGTAAAGNTFQILAGNYTGSGFTTTSTIVNSTSFYTTPVTGVNGSSNLTLASTSLTAPTTLLLNVNAISGTPPQGGLLVVTLRVTRSLQ